MIRNLLLGAAASALAAACTTAPAPAPDENSVEISVIEEVSSYDRALATAEDLVTAGNVPTAIDRLTQELGNPDLTDAQRASLYFERGQLRVSDGGFDVYGGVSDFEQVVDTFPDSSVAADAGTLLGIARGEATSLNFILEQPESSRTQRFEALFRLGEHQEAIDLMLSSGLMPDNRHLVAMLQTGYLCDADGLAGPAYGVTEPDGTRRQLRFCDFGK